MNPQPITAAWGTLPLSAKIVVAGVALAVMAIVSGGVGGIVTKWHDRRFDRAESERALEREKFAADRDAAIRRAEAAEAKASVLEAQNEAQKQLLAGAGKAIVAKDKAVQEVVNEYTREIDSVSGSGQSPAERAADVRRRLRELGYLPE